ncbi:MAG: TolC family protein [Lewinellaceae bacterium]|nr:TolC family protein [Saprospiraceae bacterium]MCB9331864.1 TolC family protein [Lewinellaceae bacterium]
MMKGLLLPLLCCAWAVMSVAQPATSRIVSLSETLELAIANSAKVKKAQLDRQALEIKLKEGRSAFAPKINASLGIDYVPVLPTTFLPSGLYGGGPDGGYVAATLGQPWQLTGTARLDQPIYNEAARRMAPAANVSRGIYDLLTTMAEEDVLYNTATVFYQTLQTEKLLDAVNANLAKLTALERMAELQLANGYAIPTDVKRIRVARTNLETQRHTLVSNIEALHQTLQFLCGIPTETAFDLKAEMNNPAADSSRWQSLALELESTTEFRLLQRQIELNNIQTRSLRGAMAPSLSAYAATAFQAQRPDANFFETDRRWYGFGAAGFKLDIPIFDGFLHRRKAAQLAIEGLKIEEDRRYLADAKTLEYKLARVQFDGAIQMLRTQEENVALARDITENLVLQYKEGVAPLTDLLNAQTALTEAETHYWQQVFNYKLAVLKLLKAAGYLRVLREG